MLCASRSPEQAEEKEADVRMGLNDDTVPDVLVRNRSVLKTSALPV